ncbi:proline dehydrogenase family protein, partial [Klebsiella pneumoniae]
ALYAQLGQDRPEIAHRTYAPVGSHRDLLAYLVRRLLENGANSSFVALAADNRVSIVDLLRRPAEIIGADDNAAYSGIPLPADLYRPQRENSHGIEFGERKALDALTSAITVEPKAASGAVAASTNEQANAAVAAARSGFKAWNATPATRRAAMLDKAA